MWFILNKGEDIMKLELFQTTVKEYQRFTQQLPIDYLKALSGDLSEFTYIASQTRLMLLRKYTRSGRGNLYLVDIAAEAIIKFPEHVNYLSEFQARFQRLCEQFLKRILADGTERTLNESIDDTMYGLHLHADEERINRIAQDNELLRIYGVLTFVKEIDILIIEISDFFETNGVSCIEKAYHLHAPVIQLEAQNSNVQNVTGSPFWRNLIGYDITEENLLSSSVIWHEQHSNEEKQLWSTASAFAQALIQEPFSYDEIKKYIYEPRIGDWGDFSEAITFYKTIPSPGISTSIRYNEQRDTVSIYVYPHVEEGFIVDSPQIISDVYTIMLAKDQKIGEWKVFAFGGAH